MTRRGKILLGIAIGIPAAFAVFSAIVAFIVLRTLETTTAQPAAATAAFEEIRRSFPQRPPLIEVVNLRAGDVKINRQPGAPRKAIANLHYIVWDPEEQEMTRGTAPTWLAHMRVSITGIGNWSFSDLHVTVEDIERYAPGIVVDFKTPEGQQVLVWAK